MGPAGRGSPRHGGSPSGAPAPLPRAPSSVSRLECAHGGRYGVTPPVIAYRRGDWARSPSAESPVAMDEVGFVIDASPRPAQALLQRPARTAKPNTERSPILVELAWLVFLVWIYNWLQDLAPLRRKMAFSNAEAVLSFERRSGLDPEAVLDHWLAHQHILALAASNFYAIAIFAVTFGLAVWTWWRRPDIYVPMRNCIVLANLIAFVVFWAFPVAPPRMLPGFVDVVANAGGLGWHNSLVSHADQLAAMPSMHMGYAVWCALVMWRLARPHPQGLGGPLWRRLPTFDELRRYRYRQSLPRGRPGRDSHHTRCLGLGRASAPMPAAPAGPHNRSGARLPGNAVCPGHCDF